jgi:hypothetical protein
MSRLAPSQEFVGAPSALDDCLNELGVLRGPKAVGSSENSEAMEWVKFLHSLHDQLRRTKRRPHPSHLRQVPERTSRCRQVEVKKSDRLAVSVDHVLRTHVVMTDDRPALGVRHLLRPLQAGRKIQRRSN